MENDEQKHDCRTDPFPLFHDCRTDPFPLFQTPTLAMLMKLLGLIYFVFISAYVSWGQNFCAQGYFNQTNYSAEGKYVESRVCDFSVFVVSNTFQIRYGVRSRPVKAEPKIVTSKAFEEVFDFTLGSDGTNTYNFNGDPRSESCMSQVDLGASPTDQDPIGSILWVEYCSSLKERNNNVDLAFPNTLGAWFFWLGLKSSDIKVEVSPFEKEPSLLRVAEFIAPNYRIDKTDRGVLVKRALPDVYNQGFVCLRLSTQSLTNLAGIVVPNKFEHVRYNYKTNALTASDLFVIETCDFLLTNISECLTIPPIFSKERSTDVTVFDKRFSKKPNNVLLHYSVTNGLFLPLNNPRLDQLLKASGGTIEVPNPVTPRKKLIIFILLANICVIPLLVSLFVRNNSKKQTKGK